MDKNKKGDNQSWNIYRKDDIIIRKGILHILDSHTGYLGLSSQLLEMGPDLMEFVRGHIFKIMESDDAKRCQFNGSVSPVLSLLESMEESDDESFIEATRVLGENLFDIMCDSVTIPAADLLCVTFQVQSVIHIALLKMNYKVTYVHREEEDAEANDIVETKSYANGFGKAYRSSDHRSDRIQSTSCREKV